MKTNLIIGLLIGIGLTLLSYEMGLFKRTNFETKEALVKSVNTEGYNIGDTLYVMEYGSITNIKECSLDSVPLGIIKRDSTIILDSSLYENACNSTAPPLIISKKL